ncbi:MAG: hypothetical protein CMJ32_10940 [Phycisphaerae bacterium]|nr:hypothetical protein [Phycisphaerae bacterium]
MRPLENITPENVANGLALLVFAILSGLGLYSGRRVGKAEPQSSMTVAGALIDGKDARELKDAMLRCAEATEESARQVERATAQMQRMTDELIRGQR